MLPQTEVVQGIQDELEGFATLLRSLDERDWARPSRCEGWTVSDVAGHLVGAFADLVAGRNEGQGTAEVSERQAAERRGHTAGEVADELDEVTVRTVKMVASFSDAVWAGQAGGGYELTVGQAMEAFWCGAYLHADDIRAAVGRSSERGSGLRGGVLYVADVLTKRSWGPAVLALDGMQEVPVGDAGGGSSARAHHRRSSGLPIGSHGSRGSGTAWP